MMNESSLVKKAVHGTKWRKRKWRKSIKRRKRTDRELIRGRGVLRGGRIGGGRVTGRDGIRGRGVLRGEGSGESGGRLSGEGGGGGGRGANGVRV